MAYIKKKAVISRDCVACGNCVRQCPVDALSIHRGIRAAVDSQRCVGCGKCVKKCPAEVIHVVLQEAVNEKEMV